jgi:hypothetical protein
MADRHPPPALFVTWQDRASRKIFPVGRLVRLAEPASAYEFAYVYGAREAAAVGFEPFLAFPSLDGVYRTRELPPFFGNRVMGHGRPDYAKFVQRLALVPDTANADQILARSGGVRATDPIEVFAEPERLQDGRFQCIFLVRSIRHLPNGEAVAATLEVGQRLYCMLDIQNERNPRAVALRTDDGRIVGYCPDYLADELDKRLGTDPSAEINVLAVNPGPVPVHYRVLCDLRLTIPGGARPFRSHRLEPIAPTAVRLEGESDVPRVA